MYLFRNVQNGKVYIGQSCNIPKRCAPCNYKGSIFFYRAIEKYGWDSFIQIILKEGLTQELANMWEKHLLNFLTQLMQGSDTTWLMVVQRVVRFTAKGMVFITRNIRMLH